MFSLFKISLVFSLLLCSLHIHPPYCIQISRVREKNYISISLSFVSLSLCYILCMYVYLIERINRYV